MSQEISAKEKSLNPESMAKETKANKTNEELDADILVTVRAADGKKALNIVVLDLREIASFTDYFVITSGANTRQVQAIADSVEEELKKQQKKRPLRIEGYTSAEWVLVDYGDFVVHVFEDKARKFYDLERLWREAKRVEIK